MYYEQLIDVYTFGNVSLLVASAITFGFGFWEYIYSFRLVRREGMAPFPVWMHTFYFAHDSSWAFMLFVAAARHNWNWFLLAASISLLAWTMFEVFNLTMAVRVERQEIFGAYFGEEVTARQAVAAIVAQVAAFYGLVNLLVVFMGPGSFFQWAAMTNMVMAAAPGLLWMRRHSRAGNGLGLALVILAGTINTFLPIGMFAQALPHVFDKPWFYITGVIFTLIAAAYVWMVARFPAKPLVAGQKRPIW
ncbi:hypothetical protein GPX89_26010 [Nocardia sp. ET3-3]|uniref:Uncharacterized protein n=1 Tax=Nocardia terrae TaxID=2675851 RepID=A0A7K1V257_9NOCA|nr:hypothetical protein [Nocardia terrae]MVU80694.1 hypothetical protein [Nocardia terrae]